MCGLVSLETFTDQQDRASLGSLVFCIVFVQKLDAVTLFKCLSTCGGHKTPDNSSSWLTSHKMSPNESLSPDESLSPNNTSEGKKQNKERRSAHF